MAGSEYSLIWCEKKALSYALHKMTMYVQIYFWGNFPTVRHICNEYQ